MSVKETVDRMVRKAGMVPPVDRSQRVLTDGSPVPETEDHRELRDDGQQKGYIVLSEEERARGYVRLVRLTYIHTPCGTVTRMAQSIAETFARDPKFYSGGFCIGCRAHFPNDQFVWQDDGSPVGS